MAQRLDFAARVAWIAVGEIGVAFPTMYRCLCEALQECGGPTTTALEGFLCDLKREVEDTDVRWEFVVESAGRLPEAWARLAGGGSLKSAGQAPPLNRETVTPQAAEV